jgi:hypothetical protein
LTKLFTVASGRFVAGIKPLPSRITRAMPASVMPACQAGSARFVAFTIGPRGPSP